MRLVEFTVKNYKSLREVKVEFGNYTALVGENGSGKTSFLEALYLFFKDFSIVGGTPSPTLQEATAWHRKSQPLEFTAEVVLDEGEWKRILPEDVFDKTIKKTEDRQGNLTIHKQILKSGNPWETMLIDIAGVSLVKDNVVVSPEELTSSISKETSKHPAKKLKASLFDPKASQSNLTGNRLVVLNDTAYHMDDYTDSLVREGKIPFEHLPGTDYKEWTASQGLKLVEKPPAKRDVDILLKGKTPVPVITPEILQNIQNKIIETIKDKIKLIPATRNERVEPGQRASFLNKSTIVDPLVNLHSTNFEVWYVIETAFEKLTEQRLDSVPSLSASEENLRLPIHLIGGGQQEIIGLLHQIHTASEPIIVIEEPEAHLHHNLSRNLSGRFKELATGKQLIVATHSEYFTEISEASKICFLEKKTRATKPQEIKTQSELLKAFGSLGAEPSDRGYPNKILFVAGETEQAVLPIWAQILRIDIKNLRIEPLNGEYGKRKVNHIKDYIKEAQTTVFLMVDNHAKEEVKQLLDDEHSLILPGTIEDCYPVATVIEVLNQNFGLNLTEGDIDSKKSRVEEIKRLLREKVGIPKRKTPKRWIGKDVAKLMSKANIPKEVKDFITKIAG